MASASRLVCVVAVGTALSAGAALGAGGDPSRVSAGSPFAGCPTRPAFTNAEVEPSLAVDPRNAKRLVAAYQQDRYHSGGARGIVVAVSRDGGRSWTGRPLPVSRCAGAGARRVPFASDPWVSVGRDGRIYVASLSDAVSVLTSPDWGATWSKPAVLRGRGLTDKPLVTADPRRGGTAYVVWSDYRPTRPPGTEPDELVSVTHDGGHSWSAPKVALRHAHRAGPGEGQILVDPRSGRLYLLAVWVRDGFVTPAEPAWMMIARSDDGGAHWSRARRFGVGTPARRRGGPVIRSSPQVPSFAIDGRGALYAAWQDSRFSGGAHDHALLTSSRDGGAHWSRPRRLDRAGAARAIIPTVAATARGELGVLYLEVGDSRGLPARYRLAISRDAGEHFRDRPVSARFHVLDAPRLTQSPIVPGGYFLGDYMGLAPLGRGGFGALYAAATGDPRNETDVFYATAH